MAVKKEKEEELEIRLVSRAPLGKLAMQDWLVWPEVQRLIAVFADAHAEIRFVGGCARDAIAKRPVKDVDIATPLPPERVIEVLASSGIKAIPTGIDHGTVTAVVGNRQFEITTLRRDVATDGRHAEVEFTDDWLEDAKRRDFTINAMSSNTDGDVYDPFEGIRDLAHGTVRFVGRADDRVQEDYLRILRYFRFWGNYGGRHANRDALAASRRHAAELRNLSGERIRSELLAILMTPQPAEVCLLMRGYGVLEHILPEAGDVTRLRVVNWLETRGILLETLSPDPIRHLAALLDTDAAGAVDVARRLRLSNHETDRLIALVAPTFTVSPDQTPHDHERMLRRVGVEEFRDLALLSWASEIGSGGRLPAPRSRAWQDVMEFADAWQGRVFPLQGRDLLALGLPPGPQIGAVLDKVENWWEDGGYAADLEACLDQARLILGDAV